MCLSRDLTPKRRTSGSGRMSRRVCRASSCSIAASSGSGGAETAAVEERADMLVEAGGEYEARVLVVEILACNDYKANH